MCSNYIPAGADEDTDDEFTVETPFDRFVEKTCANLKITIVPDVIKNAGLNGQPFDSKLDDSVHEWFEQFKKVFNVYKRCARISNGLQQFYSSRSNPYIDVLKLLANCPISDYSKANSLAFKIMEEISLFKSQHDSSRVTNLIDDNLKMVAFNLIKKHGQQQLKFIVNAYNLKASKYLFIDKIKELIDQQMYKEVCQICYELELYNEFTIFDFVFPLVLQDKHTPAEEYLTRAVNLQRPFVELLDSLIDRSQSVVSNCNRYIVKYDYKNVKYSKLQTKPLTKLITRLAKKFNVDTELLPHFHRIKNYGALQFLLNKKYVDRSLNKDSWEEMVKETVPHNIPELQIILIDACSDNRDYEEAYKWCKYFKIPENKIPSLVRSYMYETQGLCMSSVAEAENWDVGACSSVATMTYSSSDVIVIDDDNLLTLLLDDAHIIIVDTDRKFHDMLGELKEQQLVAFDSEWKPTFGASNELALIQLATRQYVFLVDVVVLQIDTSYWNNLARVLFNNEEILKISFSPSSDLAMLQKIIPSFNPVRNSSSYLDLQELWRKINNIRAFKFPYDHLEEGTTENLSNLVRKCLGKKLDKSNQFSNWERRPLRIDQIRYAALDAFCLLQIYDVIEQEMEKIGINYNEYVYNFLVESKSVSGSGNKRKQAKNKANNSNNNSRGYDTGGSPGAVPECRAVPGPNMQSVRATEIKFVTDNMLGGLGKALRRIGIDTIILETWDSHDKCIKLSMDERRYILTRGQLYNRYVQYIPESCCLKLRNDAVENQLIETLQYFNVIVSEEDVFSRCQLCNSNQFIEMDRQNLQYLRSLHKMSTTGGPPTVSPNTSQRSNSSFSKYSQSSIRRSWILTPYTMHHQNTCRTRSGAFMQIFDVNRGVLETNQTFYICEGCGKCYWDGSHVSNSLSNAMVDVLKVNKPQNLL